MHSDVSVIFFIFKGRGRLPNERWGEKSPKENRNGLRKSTDVQISHYFGGLFEIGKF